MIETILSTLKTAAGRVVAFVREAVSTGYQRARGWRVSRYIASKLGHDRACDTGTNIETATNPTDSTTGQTTTAVPASTDTGKLADVEAPRAERHGPTNGAACPS